jgi:hypothetical protein
MVATATRLNPATATRLNPTDIEVYHGRARPSVLLLPAEAVG